jgi:hypothetical protein
MKPMVEATPTSAATAGPVTIESMMRARRQFCLIY